MTQPIIQTSFHAGEWAPALNARVDLAKYHAGAALLRNFFVDYRGGASTRTGTKYIAAAKYGDRTTRLIPFQASFTISYILEFGDQYLRFYSNGAQIMSGGNPYEIATPYTASELSGIKFAQNVDSLILCHPNHQPAVLTLIAPTNWTLGYIAFGSNIGIPTGLSVASTLSAGSVNYAYTVTAVDANGQESSPATPATLLSKQDIRTTSGTNTLTWSAVSGAISYNVYRAEPSYAGAPPAGAAYGFLGNCTGVSFNDSNINPDFSQGPPVTQNPFQGAGVASYGVTNNGPGYTSVPDVTIGAPPAGGTQATAQAVMGVLSLVVTAGGDGYSVGQVISLGVSFGGSVVCTVTVTFTGGGGAVTGASVTWPGAISSGTLPIFLKDVNKTTPHDAEFTVTNWGVIAVGGISPGSGYTSPPSVTFSSGAAAATAILDAASAGNPSVVSFFQQRMVLAAPPGAVQTFYMSQPGSYYNFNISNPIEPDDAITGTIVDGHLNEIQSLLSVPTGLMALTSRAAWLINGGGGGSAITPIDAQANAHSYNGASEVPPIISNYDILFVQAKGSIVRDLAFNFYAQIFTGTDISILSSHLFYGHTILQWAWAEEPFKVIWAIRDDGVLLSLTFLKEQELIGWAHSDTDGLFKSIATVTEQTSSGFVDAIYVIVERIVNGSTVKYVERLAERIFPNGAQDAWCVDAGIQYNGAPTTTFSGAAHLAGKTVTGLADGIVIPPFVMDVSGNFTLGTAASKVTVGIPFISQLQTLRLDTGEPTIQGKRKKITGVTVRVADTLGLSIGRSFSTLVPMKDLVIGNVGSASNTVITGLVTNDARTIIDSSWTVDGQYCIQQSYPLPATVLGVIPEIQVGDAK